MQLKLDLSDPTVLLGLCAFCGCGVATEKRMATALRLTSILPGGITVTLRMLVDDVTGSDLVITNFVVFPDTQRKIGHGTAVLRKFLEYARCVGARDVRATQVGQHVCGFWKRNGFVLVPPPNNTGDLVRRLTN